MNRRGADSTSDSISHANSFHDIQYPYLPGLVARCLPIELLDEQRLVYIKPIGQLQEDKCAGSAAVPTSPHQDCDEATTIAVLEHADVLGDYLSSQERSAARARPAEF
jgi:hypothetical protein